MGSASASVKSDDFPRVIRPRWKTALFGGLAGVLVVLVSAIVSEIVLRALYAEAEVSGKYWGSGAFEADDAAGFRHRAGFRGRAIRDGAFDCQVEIQENSLRQKTFKQQMGYADRLLLLGDSFTFGLGVEEEAAFPALMQTVLNSHGVGVINGGQTSYSTDQEVAFGKCLAASVEPTAILICVYPDNDVIGNYYRGHQNVDIVRGYRLQKDRRLPIPPIDFLRTRSYLWMFIEAQFQDRTRATRLAEYRQLAVEQPERLMRPTLEAFIDLKRFCDARGIKLGVALIPSAERDPFTAPLKYILREIGISVFDLSVAGLGPEHRFSGDDHWNERGHAVAARYLAPYCLRMLGVP